MEAHVEAFTESWPRDLGAGSERVSTAEKNINCLHKELLSPLLDPESVLETSPWLHYQKVGKGRRAGGRKIQPSPFPFKTPGGLEPLGV